MQSQRNSSLSWTLVSIRDLVRGASRLRPPFGPACLETDRKLRALAELPPDPEDESRKTLWHLQIMRNGLMPSKQWPSTFAS
jgi:hypothetical protein